ncbi:30S ribosome-binding factor RbfA [Capnocytophaga catalasegens]|uniref:Ribosome-binding factor A n=1 Tax=Capnocytophaga catalasegens TaxID=1004260 RepID=A0AAV5AW39_9FLAO|nr:30S ribosome-binding factor RbfA [Capnocytophaga catalasegens]GIZ15656.1 ribosome-binding factor A [Capnocytophaga catalasegens]GJM49551.1 ribosome-binding factor A [Capnocytophaga catalasegens]GJM51740.1 ribosome-binding factor A [Capnocytophaga catalasegens]
MESNRQKKIAGILQKELAEILQKAVRQGGLTNLIISVTKVHITVDLTIAKVYISIFPNEKSQEIIAGIRSNAHLIKHEIAQLTRHQLRKMPELEFFIDDSLEYLNQIERSLTGVDNPIENPELLQRRKKS